MLYRIALKRVGISLRIYRHMPLLDWPARHFGKLAGIPDDDQRLRAVGWSPNLSSQLGRINKILLVVLTRRPGQIRSDQNLSQAIPRMIKIFAPLNSVSREDRGQRPGAEAVLARRDALALLPTGGRKTLVFKVHR